MTSGNYIPVRSLQWGDELIVKFLNADGTKLPEGAITPSTQGFPKEKITDARYKLGKRRFERRLRENLLWLSDNKPLMFEELLYLLEGLEDKQVVTVSKLLDSPFLRPDRKVPESYVYTFYQSIFSTLPLITALAEDGWHGRVEDRAWSLFSSARVCCGYTVEHPCFKAAILAVWIMQDKHHPLKDPLKAKDNEENLAFVDSNFDELYDVRHELRLRGTIDASSIEEFLKHDGPLRLGTL